GDRPARPALGPGAILAGMAAAAGAGCCFTLVALALAIAGCASPVSHATHAQVPAASRPRLRRPPAQHVSRTGHHRSGTAGCAGGGPGRAALPVRRWPE